MKRLLIVLIRTYQLFISPFFPPRCIHQPTCSQYALESISRHGIIRGLALSVRRLLHCHPFASGGYDPVP